MYICTGVYFMVTVVFADSYIPVTGAACMTPKHHNRGRQTRNQLLYVLVLVMPWYDKGVTFVFSGPL